MTVGDGALEKDTVQETAKAVVAETKVKAAKSASSNGKKTARTAAKSYSGLDAKTLVGLYRTMYTVAADRRQRDPAKGSEQDLFPDLGCGTRSAFWSARRWR